MIPLTPGAQPSNLSIEPGQYKHAEKMNDESVDGYILDAPNRRLLLFQITRSFDYPVKVQGLRLQLKRLGLLAQVGKLKIALVFVVAKGMDALRSQPMELPDHVFRVNSCVSTLGGIGAKRAASLARIGIKTVGQLMRSMEAYTPLRNRHRLRNP